MEFFLRGVFLFFFFKLSNFFIFGCTGSLLLTWDFSDCGELRLLSSYAVWVSHFRGISCCITQILGYMGLAVVTQGLSCLQPWNLPRSGIELLSLVLGGGFLTTGLPGKSWWCFFREQRI